MALYRRHTGSLEDSLKTTVIVKNMDELRDKIYEEWKMWEGVLKRDGEKFSKDSFVILIQTYEGEECDFRCGWYTQIVSADLEEKCKFVPVGYLSEPLE